MEAHSRLWIIVPLTSAWMSAHSRKSIRTRGNSNRKIELTHFLQRNFSQLSCVFFCVWAPTSARHCVCCEQRLTLLISDSTIWHWCRMSLTTVSNESLHFLIIPGPKTIAINKEVGCVLFNLILHFAWPCREATKLSLSRALALTQIPRLH